MAIDTQTKRLSTISVTGDILPVPDSSIDQGDRQTLLKRFSGILAGSVVEVVINQARPLAVKIGISL